MSSKFDLKEGSAANISGDVVGGGKSISHQAVDYAALFREMRAGDASAQAELWRILLDNSIRMNDEVSAINQSVGLLVEVINAQGDQTKSLAEAINILRRELRLKETIQQQMELLQMLQNG